MNNHNDMERPENIIGWLLIAAGVFLGIIELLDWITR